MITPNAINFTFNGMLDNNVAFDLWTYNIETIIAEKVETILRRSVFNTRPRDYYDVYILYSTQRHDKSVFLDALSATAEHRRTTEQIGDYLKSLNIITESTVLMNQWDAYRKQFNYAKDITFSMIINVLTELLS